MTAIADPGLQPERTLLAWRRTILALALGVALAVRYVDLGGPAIALAVGVPALVVLAVAYATTTVRYRRVARDLAIGEGEMPGVGGAVTMVAMIALVLGLGSLLALVPAVGLTP